MREIKTIGDLKEAGLLKGMYPILENWYFRRYRCEHIEPYVNLIAVWERRKHEPEMRLHTCGSSLYRTAMGRCFLNEPVEYLQIIPFSKIIGFGHGKKEAQMKIIFENLGFDWRVN